MPKPNSNLLVTECYDIMQKRERRLIKMMIKKEKEAEGEKHSENFRNQILEELEMDLEDDGDSSKD